MGNGKWEMGNGKWEMGNGQKKKLDSLLNNKFSRAYEFGVVSCEQNNPSIKPSGFSLIANANFYYLIL